MLVRIWRKRNTPSLLVGLQTGTAPLKINLVALRKLEIVLLEDPAILTITQKMLQHITRTDASYVYNNLIYNNQKLETT